MLAALVCESTVESEIVWPCAGTTPIVPARAAATRIVIFIAPTRTTIQGQPRARSTAFSHNNAAHPGAASPITKCLRPTGSVIRITLHSCHSSQRRDVRDAPPIIAAGSSVTTYSAAGVRASDRVQGGVVDGVDGAVGADEGGRVGLGAGSVEVDALGQGVAGEIPSVQDPVLAVDDHRVGRGVDDGGVDAPFIARSGGRSGLVRGREDGLNGPHD